MPKYVYWCRACETIIETSHEKDKFVVPTCPKCLGQMRKSYIRRSKEN